MQLSDAHVGFNGLPDPLGTKAFERAVDMVNALPQRPDLVLFTGDLIHDSEDKDVQIQRMKQFREISKRMNVPLVKYVPGEHDAGLDGGQLYREAFEKVITPSTIVACILSRSTMFHAPSLKLAPSSWPG